MTHPTVMDDSRNVEQLDRAIWSALTTHHAEFALGGGLGRRYPTVMSPLAGVSEVSAEAFAELRDATAPGDFVAMFFAQAPKVAPGWELMREVPLAQMVWEGKRDVTRRSVPFGFVQSPPSAGMPGSIGIETLGEHDVDAMLALVEMTTPGPFGPRTIELGNYFGIREGGRLVAMAGERLRMPGFTEVSAVCTHPEFTGRGYARALMGKVMEEIVKRGERPFLHVARENSRAMGIYAELGFRVRWEGTVVVWGRPG